MSIQKFDHRARHILVTGKSGTGKTTLAARLAKSHRATYKFVYDHQGEFARRFNCRPLTDIDELIEKTAEAGYICYDPLVNFPGKSSVGFEFFCDYVFSVGTRLNGVKLFFCDELQKVSGRTEEPEELLTLIETGRSYQIDAIFIAQSPNRLHCAIREQITQCYSFAHSDENALKFLTQNGFDPQKIRNLSPEKHEWIARNFDTGEITSSSPALLTNSTGTASPADSVKR
jgi:GTPase SAR1 family protein